jgi:hypothetical protein
VHRPKQEGFHLPPTATPSPFRLTKLIIPFNHYRAEVAEEKALTIRKFRIIKPEIRVLGVDDGQFTPHKGHVLVVGVVFRGGYWLDGVLSTKVRVDGFDATEKVAAMIVGSSHFRQVRVLMLDGLTFGGFNVVDIRTLNGLTGLPVIVVTRDKPDFGQIHAALKNLPRSVERWRAVRNAGRVFEVQTRRRGERVYMEVCGVLESDARTILRLTSTRSSIPEALRVAHIIASGVSRV